MHIYNETARKLLPPEPRERGEKECANKFQITACIYIAKKRKEQFASKFNISVVFLVPVFWNKTCIKSNQNEQEQSTSRGVSDLIISFAAD